MIWTFSGKNGFLIDQALRQKYNNFREAVGDLGIEKIDAADVSYGTIIQSVQALPFLVANKLVIISNISTNAELLDNLQTLIDRTPDSVDVVLIDQNVDKRKQYYKLLQQKTELHEFQEPKPDDMPSWVVNYAKELGGKITLADARYLTNRAGNKQQLLAREIEKIVSYNPDISRETIDLLTDESLHSTIFNLLDAAFAGDKKTAIKIYRDQRQARVEPYYIISMLVWQLFSIAQAAHAEPATEATLVANGMSPFTARKSLAIAKRVGRNKLKKIINELAELDKNIKTSADSDAGVELFLMQL